MTAPSDPSPPDQPPHGSPASPLRPWMVIAAAAVVTILVLVVAGNWLGGTPEPSASDPSQNPSQNPSQAASETPSATETPSLPPGIGVTWTPVATFPGSGVGDLTAGGPGFVAVGGSGPVSCDACPGLEAYAGMIWTSVDGRTWNEVALQGLAGSTLYQVAATPDWLVARGVRDLNPDPAQVEEVHQFLSSTDGLTWLETDIADTYTTRFNDLIGGSIFILGGSVLDADGIEHAVLWTSTDGRDWQEVHRSNEWSSVASVTATANGWLAVGGANRELPVTTAATCPVNPCEPELYGFPVFWTSDDGSHWTQHDLPLGSTAFAGSARFALDSSLGLIVIGDGSYPDVVADSEIQGFAAWRSLDGVTWESAPVTADFLENVGGGFLAYDAGGHVFAIGSGCNCGTGEPFRWWNTTDGLNWIQHDDTAAPIPHSVIEVDDGLLATGRSDGSGAILSSP